MECSASQFMRIRVLVMPFQTGILRDGLASSVTRSEPHQAGVEVQEL